MMLSDVLRPVLTIVLIRLTVLLDLHMGSSPTVGSLVRSPK